MTVLNSIETAPCLPLLAVKGLPPETTTIRARAASCVRKLTSNTTDILSKENANPDTSQALATDLRYRLGEIAETLAGLDHAIQRV